MILSITLHDVIDHFVPVFPAEINIEIGWGCPVGVKESFKIKIEFYRIDIGYLQAIRNDGIGTAATTDVIKSPTLRIPYDIPGDQEIGIKV